MPAKSQFLSKLREDQQVSDVFLVRQKQVASGRTGRNYLRMTLGDASGSMETRVWEGADELAARFNQGDLVFVTGVVTSYQGVLQIKATFVEKIDEDDATRVDWGQFLPSSENDAGQMWEEVKGLLATVQNGWLKKLLDDFLADERFTAAFVAAPAARAMHHAYVAGLLEHTLGVMKLCTRMADLYPVDRDMLVTGAFLHDIGKIEELDSRGSFDYTDVGKLLGHITIGIGMIKERVRGLEGFPPKLTLHLEHLILSHHGELEWGSPKRPKTIEALALHAADNIDAKLSAADRSLREADGLEGDWTGFLRVFERPLYKCAPPNPDMAGAKDQPPIDQRTDDELAWADYVESEDLDKPDDGEEGSGPQGSLF